MPISDLITDLVLMRDREEDFFVKVPDAELALKKRASAEKQLTRDLVEIHDLDLSDSADVERLETMVDEYTDRLAYALTVLQLEMIFDAPPRSEHNQVRAKKYAAEYSRLRGAFNGLVKSRSRGGAGVIVFTRSH